MKRLLTATLLLALPGTALAGNQNMAGCGLGSQWFDENTTGSQLLASTTNGTSGNQSFGITSGTSGCTADGAVKKAKAQEAYAEANFEHLSTEMAAGGGEYLANLGTLMGCKQEAMPAMFELAQQRYERILPSEHTTPMAMLGNLRAEMVARPELARSCSALPQPKVAAQPKPVKTAKVAPRL